MSNSRSGGKEWRLTSWMGRGWRQWDGSGWERVRAVKRLIGVSGAGERGERGGW